MTEISLGREKVIEYRYTLVLDKIITVCLMVLGTVLALGLLDWAVDKKISKSKGLESSAITAELRTEQLHCLAQNIYYEAGYEPFEGKVAVAQVVINRVNSGKFPNDICRVIYQKNIAYEKILCQFSWVCDKAVKVRPVHAKAYEESVEVAKKVLLEGFRLPSLTDAMYFHADYINPKWERKRVAQIGRHIFYE